jgi:hypothetical protein
MPHMPYEKSKMIDITRDKPIKITVRVAVPVRDHPKVSETTIKTMTLHCRDGVDEFIALAWGKV